MYKKATIKTPILFGLTTLLLSSCSLLNTPLDQVSENDDNIFTSPMRDPKIFQDVITETTTTISSAETGANIKLAPVLAVKGTAESAPLFVTPKLPNTLVSRLNFNNMPVSAFINEIFSNQLSLDYVLGPSIGDITDLVTMRLNNKVSHADLYGLASRTLRAYGVTTALRDDVLFFSYSGETSNEEIPLLLTGRALPTVPSTNRPIFYIYPLQAVRTPTVRSLLTGMFNTKELIVDEDAMRNALVFRGPQSLVNQAVEATRLLDLPVMKGMLSRVFKPSLNNVVNLADNLERVLNAQGYSVTQPPGIAAIRLLPLESVNQLVIFTRSSEVLEHVLAWAQTLEEEEYSQVEYGLFNYQVQSTSALHIVETIRDLGIASFTSPTSQIASQPGGIRSSPNTTTTANNRFAVDEQLNTILFSGNGNDWLQVLTIIQALDKPAPSVMVEVILAEVQLKDVRQRGIEWLANSATNQFGINFGTLDGLGVGGSGFRLTLDNAGQTRALLNFFYNNEKAVIRSRPRLMVKSGGTGTIDVGNEIPIITTNTKSLDNPNAPLVQNISYRKTGVLLDIKPIVHAAGFVEIEISQELSEAVATSSSNIDSPTILNRKLTTTVTLQDGGSVLIGGLISSNSSKGSRGVPFFGQLPILKEFFSGRTNDQLRTELMIMIIPYILSTPNEAEGLGDELQRARMKLLSD
jgi:general secretion pathway protein D